MPSPFPGMDPYLEAPTLWPGVHNRVIAAISDLLSPQLRPKYFVDVERRVYVLDEDDPAQRHVVPDLALVTTGRRGAAPDVERAAQGASVLLMVMDQVEVSEPRLVVREVAGGGLVTVIEVLSPTNKTPGSSGREEYLKKRREILHSPVHLLEIDLLRAGGRVPSVEPLPPADYMVHVSRARLRPRGEVFAWSVRAAAPVVPVPLRDQDADATLDLGAAIRLVYERANYDLAIDYTKPAHPPLPPEDQAWATNLTR